MHFKKSNDNQSTILHGDDGDKCERGDDKNYT